jgi:hypothetical protein
MSGITDSAKFNNASSYYFPSNGNQVLGVSALNGKAGALSLASADNSVVFTSGGTSIIDASTTGTVQAPASVAATGAISGNSLAVVTSITAGGGITGGLLTQQATASIPCTGSGTISGTWKATKQYIGGMERNTYTLLNNPFDATTVLNVPIQGNVASRISVFCVNNGNTQSRSIQALYSISVASGVFTQGPVYETNFNMTPTWIGSGGATPLTYTVQLSGGGGGLVGTISIIVVQDQVVS